MIDCIRNELFVFMLQYIKEEHSHAKREQSLYFSFDPTKHCIELKFGAPQDEPFTGWTIRPHIKPCIVSVSMNCFMYIDIL